MSLKYFDQSYYLNSNPDVAKSVWSSNPAGHYESYGRSEGRSPNQFFSEPFYRQQNRDVDKAVRSGQIKSGYDHWISYGQFENRSPNFVAASYPYASNAVVGFTSINRYLDNNPDIKAAYRSGQLYSPWEHYVQWGYSENRSSRLGLVSTGSSDNDNIVLMSQTSLQTPWTISAGDGDDLINIGVDNFRNMSIPNRLVFGSYLDGGAGNDTIRGNGVSDTVIGGTGDDVLYSSTGNDLLYGGDGADIFVFTNVSIERTLYPYGSGNDVIYDFNVAEGDRIGLSGDLSSYTVGTNSAGDATIVFSNNDTVTLKGVSRNAVTSALFVAV